METVEHLLCECPRWAAQRQRYLAAMIEHIHGLLPNTTAGVRMGATAILLLGGRRATVPLDGDLDRLVAFDGGDAWVRMWLGSLPPTAATTTDNTGVEVVNAPPAHGVAVPPALGVVQGAAVPPALGVAQGAAVPPALGVVQGTREGTIDPHLSYLPFLRVAQFLSVVLPLRQIRLRRIRAEAEAV